MISSGRWTYLTLVFFATCCGRTQTLNEQQELVAEHVEEENDLKSQLEECQQDKEDTKRTLTELLQSKQVMSARQLEA